MLCYIKVDNLLCFLINDTVRHILQQYSLCFAILWINYAIKVKIGNTCWLLFQFPVCPFCQTLLPNPATQPVGTTSSLEFTAPFTLQQRVVPPSACHISHRSNKLCGLQSSPTSRTDLAAGVWTLEGVDVISKQMWQPWRTELLYRVVTERMRVLDERRSVAAGRAVVNAADARTGHFTGANRTTYSRLLGLTERYRSHSVSRGWLGGKSPGHVPEGTPGKGFKNV